MGDPSSVPGSGRAGEGIGYPLQDSWGFPGGSAGKESACNVGDPSSVPGTRIPPGEGIGYPLQDSWGFPSDLAGKESACNVGDLGWEDPLEEGKAIHSSILTWSIPRTV